MRSAAQFLHYSKADSRLEDLPRRVVICNWSKRLTNRDEMKRLYFAIENSNVIDQKWFLWIGGMHGHMIQKCVGKRPE